MERPRAGVKEEERATRAKALFFVLARRRVGRPFPSSPRSLSRRIFSSVGDVEAQTDTDLPEFYVSKRVIVLVAGVSHGAPPPIFHNGCCHSRRSRFRRECRRHASPKNFLQDRLSGSG